MNKCISVVVVFLMFQFAAASQHYVSCSFKGVQQGAAVTDLGSTKKMIHPKLDFSLEVPKTHKKNWKSLIEEMQVSGSNEFPEQGWIGMAISSPRKLNDGWACIKLIEGQELVLTQRFGEQTIIAKCLIQ